MSHVLAIAGRELRAMFVTPIAYVMMAAYLVFGGYIFFLSLSLFLQQLQQIQAMQLFQYLEQFNLNDAVIQPALGTYSFLFILLIPLLTMRAFSDERANGTFELLLTSPVSTWQIVLGKYLAVLAMLGVLVGLAALHPALLFLYGDPEVLQTLAGLLGLFLYAAALGAIGCFVSSLTASQLVAAFVTVVAGLLLLLLDVLADMVPGGVSQEVVRYLGIREHFEKPLSGVIRTQDLAYFGAMIVFFLALTRTSVESLRWR